MAAIADLIRYFRACYQADFRALHLLDFFSSRVEHRLTLPTAELLDGRLGQYPAASDWAKQVRERLVLYEKEKALYLGAFFLRGHTTVAGRRRQVCAPLLLYPAELIREEEVDYLILAAGEGAVNPAVVEVLNGEPGEAAAVYATLMRELPHGYVGFDEVHAIESVLRGLFPALDVSALARYPELEALPARPPAAADGPFAYRLVPALGVGLLAKSTGSRGVLNELEAIAGGNLYSDALLALFRGDVGPRPRLGREAPILTPATLSQPQLRILRAARRRPLSLAVGPPGTGKSFTIAALAVDAVSRGETVLIAARNLAAVDVVADKVERDFGLPGIVVRAGRGDYKKQILRRLDNLLHGIGREPDAAGRSGYRPAETDARRRQREVLRLERLLKHTLQRERTYGEWLSPENGSVWSPLRRRLVAWRQSREAALWNLAQQYETALTARNQAVQNLIRRRFGHYLDQALDRHRADLQHLVRGLRARTGARKETFFDFADFRRILRALPVWITNTADVSQVLPLERGLFDLVIIDEATQCDVASALPLLQRGRRAVIAGDPRQLRHLSFLSRERQDLLARRFGLQHLDTLLLDYRGQSLLDHASARLASGEPVNFLHEHYRSHPDIIAFSNRYFYENKLHIMTAAPGARTGRGLFLHRTPGRRDRTEVNREEAGHLLGKLLDIIVAEASLPPNLCRSIGILSPFRRQVDYLRSQIEHTLNAGQIERHRLLIGTAHAFQGEERDVMLLSLTIDDDAHPATLQYLNQPDVFNVSITRARHAQHVFLSADPARLPNDSLLGRYLGGLLNDAPTARLPAGPPPDPFAEEVSRWLRDLPVDDIHTNHAFADTVIDLVVHHRGRLACIDLVGYPGASRDAIPVEQLRMMGRVGLPVFVLPYSRWLLDRDGCERALKRLIVD